MRIGFMLKTGLTLVFLILITGCGSLPNGRGWGQDATLFPGWDRVQKAARNTVVSPQVWVPIGAALLLQIDHADESLSDWASDHTPLFGSNDAAADASDILNASSFVFFGATALAMPSENQEGEWVWSKTKGVGTQMSALLLTLGTTELLKTTAGRSRPNMEDDKSFPSGHASTTAVNSMLAYKNVDQLLIPRWSKITLKTGAVVLPYATGWARLEAKMHYPSDVLVGIAIGNFFGAFINDAFLGVDSADDLHLMFDYRSRDSFAIGLNRWF